jgi:hypothetical protein
VTDTCKLQYRNCAGGKYDPTASPRRGELAPRYSVVGMNRPDGPEDFAAGTRSLPGRLPEFASISFRRIVQTPSGISMIYDGRQSQGRRWTIVMDRRPHLPPHPPMVRRFARPREGNTLPGFRGCRTATSASGHGRRKSAHVGLFHSSPTTGNARMTKRRPQAHCRQVVRMSRGFRGRVKARYE